MSVRPDGRADFAVRATGFWRRMRIVMAALLFAGLISSFDAAAQPKPAATNAAPSNRFLFVLETSTAMKKHAAEVDKLVESIIQNSASGQMHKGDTLGFWTFNADLYTGQYPLQMWLPENADEIALMTKEYLRQQKYVKGSRLDMAMSGVMEVVKRSDIVTIFVISTGESRFQGTPFDDTLNAALRQVLADNKGSHLPVVTVLQGKGGKLFRYTANMLPWPVVIPEVPIAIKMPAAAPAPETKAAQIAQAKPAPTPAVNPVQLPPPVTNTNTVAPAKVTPPPAAPANDVAQVNATPPPVNDPNPPKVVTPANVPVPAERANPQAHPVTAPLSAAPGPPPSQPDAIAASEPPVNVNPPIRQTPKPMPTSTPATAPVVGKPDATPPAQPNAPTQVAAVKTNSAPARATNGTNSVAPKTQQAAAVPGMFEGKSKYYLIAGVAMLALAGLLIVRMVIRGRAYRPSLISSSMGGPPKR